MKIKLITTIMLVACVLPSTFAKTTDPIISSYLNFAQDLFNNVKAFRRGVQTHKDSNFTSFAKASMYVKNPNFQRTMYMNFWGQGIKKSLVRITQPAKDRGTSTLKVGQDLWNYLPKTSRIIKIPATLMSQGWMGSDFTNNDMVRYERYVNQYTCTMKTEKNIVALNCIPDPDSVVVWGKVIFFQNKKTGIPVHIDYYDQEGKMARTFIFKKVKKLGGKLLPSEINIIPKAKDKKGHLTRLTYKSIKFNVHLSNSFFSIQNLQKGLR